MDNTANAKKLNRYLLMKGSNSKSIIKTVSPAGQCERDYVAKKGQISQHSSTFHTQKMN